MTVSHKICGASLLVVCLATLSVASFAETETCTGGSANAKECQMGIQTDSGMPALDVSNGVKFGAGIKNVLFNSYADTTPYFLSNNGTNSLFVPQASKAEYVSFLDSVVTGTLSNISYKHAISAISVSVAPVPHASCVFTPDTQRVSLAQDAFVSFSGGEAPYIYKGYVRVEDPYVNNPSLITATSTPTFTYVRNDCTTDNQNTGPRCVQTTFKETLTYLFHAKGTKPNYAWSLSDPIVGESLKASANSVPEATVSDCTGFNNAPIIKGICGPNDGQDLESIPSTGLCREGNASVVDVYNTPNYGYRWGWTCYDTQGTATGVQNTTLGSGKGCAACQSKAKQVVSACSASCGGGTQTVTWYDGCGDVQSVTQQACNTQSCCTDNASSSTGACSASCGGGSRTVTIYNSCGQVQTSYSQSCNTHSCCSPSWSCGGCSGSSKTCYDGCGNSRTQSCTYTKVGNQYCTPYWCGGVYQGCFTCGSMQSTWRGDNCQAYGWDITPDQFDFQGMPLHASCYTWR